MAEILHQDFLLNTKKYDEAVRSWEHFFDEILKEYGYTRQTYLNNVTANGTVLRDGNPIFHAYIPEIDRAVRIIQEEPEEPADFGSWINVTERPDGTPLQELVISLVLTEDTKAEAERAIRQWIETGFPVEEELVVRLKIKGEGMKEWLRINRGKLNQVISKLLEDLYKTEKLLED